MKLPSLLPLFLCGVSVLCIRSATGSYHYGHPSEKTASKGLSPLHNVQKRQTGEMCERLVLTQLCTNGVFQEYASLAVKCKDPVITARFLREYCSSNPMGEYCFHLNSGFSGTAITNICGNSPTTCTPRCRELLTTTRAQLGCCISIFNDSASVFAINPRPFRYSLWSLCGVEPVTKQCASTIDSTGIQLDDTCTLQAYNQLIYSDIACRREYVESTRDALRSSGCGDDTYYTPTLGLCAANELGEYCQTLPLQSSQFETTASTACADTSVCDPLCIATLNNITSAIGCCFIDEFNTTSNDWLSYEFWQRCDVSSPGFCEPRFSEAIVFKPQYISIILVVASVWTMCL